MDYYKQGCGKPLLYLHGFNMHPKTHPLYLKWMAEDNEVISPIFTSSKPRPRTIDDYINETYQFLNFHGINEYNVSGYSLGGGVGLGLSNKNNQPDKIIGISPLLPTHYGFTGYLKRGMICLFNQFKDIDRENYCRKLRFVKTFASNTLSAPYSSYRTIKDISKYDMKDLYITQPTQIILFSDDEFFNLDDIKQSNFNNFLNLDVCYIKHMTHDWDDAVYDIMKKNKRFLENG